MDMQGSMSDLRAQPFPRDLQELTGWPEEAHRSVLEGVCGMPRREALPGDAMSQGDESRGRSTGGDGPCGVGGPRRDGDDAPRYGRMYPEGGLGHGPPAMGLPSRAIPVSGGLPGAIGAVHGRGRTLLAGTGAPSSHRRAHDASLADRNPARFRSPRRTVHYRGGDGPAALPAFWCRGDVKPRATHAVRSSCDSLSKAMGASVFPCGASPETKRPARDRVRGSKPHAVTLSPDYSTSPNRRSASSKHWLSADNTLAGSMGRRCALSEA